MMKESTIKICGFSAVVTASLLYSSGIVTAQLLGTTYPRFELNTLRFLAQCVVSSGLIIISKQNLCGIRGLKHVGILVATSCNYTWTVLSMNLAPLYAPVGNLESVCITVYIVLNIAVGALRRTVSCTLVIAAVVSCTGVLCLTQPDFLFPHGATEVLEKDPCPCVALQGYSLEQRIHQCQIADIAQRVNTSNILNTAFKGTNMTSDIIASWKQQENSTTVQYQTSPIPGLNSETFGYLLMVTTGISFSITIQVSHSVLLPHYDHSVVSFWYGCIGCGLSALIMLCLEQPRVVGGAICVTFLVLHCVTSGSAIILNNASLHYISAEENAILSTTCVVTLFIAQSTFLASVQPSKANAFEYFGAVLVVTACLLDPICTIAKKKWKDRRIVNAKLGININDENMNENTRLLSDKDYKISNS